MDQAKQTFVRKTQDFATQIAAFLHTAEDLQAIWDSRLYGPGAANQFTDTELATLDAMGLRSCTPDDLYSFIILCAQFQTFMRNGQPAQRDYISSVNKLRMDL